MVMTPTRLQHLGSYLIAQAKHLRRSAAFHDAQALEARGLALVALARSQRSVRGAALIDSQWGR